MKKIYCLVSIFLATILIISSDVCIESNAQTDMNNMSAKSYVVIDESGNVLTEKNCEEKREVASICKLMTTLITLEYIDNGNISLKDKFLASDRACAVEGSQAFLDAGSEYSVEDLLKSVIVASANDSAIVLAEGIGGNENNFVNMMNSRAKSLGMHNTMYTNATGLSEGNQYSTALDTAKLLREVSKYDIYKNDCKIWIDELVHPSGRKTELVNTNRLIKYYPNCLTGKTGFTDEAGYCLSSTSEKNNLKLTCVVLGCSTSADRFTESVELYNYAYANFKSEKIIDKEKLLDIEIDVLSGKDKKLSVKAIDDYYLTQNINSKAEYSVIFDVVKDIKAPVKVDDKVGTLMIKVGDEIIKEIDVVSAENIEKQSFLDIFNNILENYSLIK